MAEIRLESVTGEEFESIMRDGIRRYAEENVKVGYWSPGDALKRSKEAHDRLLPQGMHTRGHHFLKAVEAREGTVGHVWLRVDAEDPRQGFIFAVFIEERLRGKGFGKAMMLALEGKARGLGLNALGLHVFAYNDVAIHLYESLGYEVKSLNMMKTL